MSAAVLAAVLVFATVIVLAAGLAWATAAGRRVRDRLEEGRQVDSELRTILRETRTGRLAGLRARLDRLAQQAGKGSVNWLYVMGGAAVAGALVGGFRMGGLFWTLVAAAVGAAVPLVYLAWVRARRLEEFRRQFPESLDMMSRSLRAGYALGGAIQLVGEEMPDPSGHEFRQVAEEIRLGVDPGEALFGLQNRVPTEDTAFFCTAIRIQRTAGGNLAEILDRLAEVIRERFKILSQARALSAQHRWSAVLVGLSPLFMAVLFQFMYPGYFDSLFKSPIGPTLIVAGLIMEAIGFFMIWRIAKIEV